MPPAQLLRAGTSQACQAEQPRQRRHAKRPPTLARGPPPQGSACVVLKRAERSSSDRTCEPPTPAQAGSRLDARRHRARAARRHACCRASGSTTRTVLAHNPAHADCRSDDQRNRHLAEPLASHPSARCRDVRAPGWSECDAAAVATRHTERRRPVRRSACCQAIAEAGSIGPYASRESITAGPVRASRCRIPAPSPPRAPAGFGARRR